MRILIHIPHGLAISAIWYWHPGGAIATLVLFSLYELNQDRHKADEAYRDLLGALVGALVGAVPIAILSALAYI